MKISEYIEKCLTDRQKLSDIALQFEMKEQKKTRKEVFDKMSVRFEVMQQSVIRGMSNEKYTYSGLCGNNTKLLSDYAKMPLLGNVGHKAMIFALAASEENARMGRIVAAPTAGSCGILPGVLLAVGEEFNINRDLQIMSLFTAGIIGHAIAQNATLSGAGGGCQAECGSASAMAASACVELMGGTVEMCGNATALALKFVMGLVCDPVCGLVEVPCVKRNASGAINALTAASLALSGIVSAIPVDEVIEAMGQVGKLILPELRETSRSGLAITPTAVQLNYNKNYCRSINKIF